MVDFMDFEGTDNCHLIEKKWKRIWLFRCSNYGSSNLVRMKAAHPTCMSITYKAREATQGTSQRVSGVL